MTIRKKVLKVTFLYDDETMAVDSWSLETVAREIATGGCIGSVENESDEALTEDQVRATEIEMGGDGTFMLGE